MGIIYKKCEVCGNKINKLKCLVFGGFNKDMKCQNCLATYQIEQTKLFNFMNSFMSNIDFFISLILAGWLSVCLYDFLRSNIILCVFVGFLLFWLFGIITIFLDSLITLMFIAKFKITKNNEVSQNIHHKADRAGLLYKKCEVCGNKINKLQQLLTENSKIKCKKCTLEYEISNIKFCELLSDIMDIFCSIAVLFFSIGFCVYIGDNYDIHWFILVLIFTALFLFLGLVIMTFTRLFLFMFVAKFKILESKNKNVAIKNRGIYSKILKIFKR